MKKTLLKYKGITLIETLVYLGLFGIIFIMIIQFLFSVTDNNTLVQNRISVNRYKLYIFEHLTETFDQADSIDEANSLFNSDSGTLNLEDLNGEEFTYTINSGNLSFNRNGETTDITPNEIRISQFRPEAIRNSANEIIGTKITIAYQFASKNWIEDEFTFTYTLH
ncbi:MAG: hypothetical protein Fur003_1760 [Candidatus Dojkabacteria bacterium]